MSEQRQESELLVSVRRGFWLKWGCSVDLCCLFSVAVDVVTETAERLYQWTDWNKFRK